MKNFRILWPKANIPFWKKFKFSNLLTNLQYKSIILKTALFSGGLFFMINQNYNLAISQSEENSDKYPKKSRNRLLILKSSNFSLHPERNEILNALKEIGVDVIEVNSLLYYVC